MDWRGALASTAWNLALIVAIVVPLLLCVAYLTVWERKLIGWIQIRIGPNRVGPAGLLQPVADGVKLLLKEIILPTNANKGLFLLAPVLMLTPALAAWAVIPFAPEVVLADINAGLLYILALRDRKSTRLNSSHGYISYAVFCLKKKKNKETSNKL